MSLRSIDFDKKRAASPFFAPQPPRSHLLTTPGGRHISRVKDVDETPKSSVPGAAFNLINGIVGAGIVGIPFAINQCSLILGVFMIIFFAVLTIKSLRLLIETAKHVDVSTYERLAEASFGRFGFNFISFSMFVMSYGAMVGYMIIIKTNLSYLLGVEADNIGMSRAVLTVSTLAIIMPLSLQRDMSNLSKTSAISIAFDTVLVGIVFKFSPVQESVRDYGGWKDLLNDSTPDIHTFFTGVGVLCFAFVCQHSAFIIAASLNKPTRARWNMVTGWALGTCCVLACIMGVSGFLGFMEDTNGDILINLGEAASAPGAGEAFQRASNIARGLLCTTMFFVFPMELFVARHVCVVTFFKGRRAHEGDAHSVLGRKDRRFSVTVFLYLISLLPAMLFDDLGCVFSVTGSLGGAALSYIGPGITYLAVHGTEFLELASQRWSYVPAGLSSDMNVSIKTTPTSISTLSTSRRVLHPNDIEKGTNDDETKRPQKNICARCIDCILWYILLMPIWCKVALIGQKMMKKHREEEALKSPMPYALGKIVHHNKPQFGHLMRPMGMGRSPEDDDSEADERQPLIRSLSNPQMGITPENRKAFAHTKNSMKLPPLNPGTKGKVGFSLGPDHSAANEKVVLDKSNPITHDSFASASFEMMRDSEITSYGATRPTSLLEEVRILQQNGKSDVEEGSAANRSAMAESSELDDGLTYEDEIESHSSSVFVDGDDDSNGNVSSGSEGNRSIQFLKKQQQSTNYSVKLVDKIPNLDALKVNPNVKKRLNERKSVVSIQTDGGKDDEEDDPQDDMPSAMDFVIAIFYILFGMVAAFAGLYSSLL